VVYRHFGAAGRSQTARRLATLCRSRGLYLLIAADPDLARRVGAHGVHWPESRIPHDREFAGLVTAAAHGADGLARAERLGADACVLGPVFPSRSGSNREPLGVFRASQLARAADMPVIALGGINERTARQLTGRGFAGVAAVDALIER
jgi:thiamine-phosphate pyrophosphorylase